MGHRQRALPAPIVPMLATPGPVPTGDGWSFEFKWDGVRALVALDPDGLLRATSRNLREITRSYPELLHLPRLVNRRVVLDGELVTLDEHGRPSFPLLAHRMHVQAPTALLLTQLPVQYYVFDLVQLDDRPLLTVPYLERRQRLADLDLNAPGLVRIPPHYTDVSGPDLLAVAADHALEGVVGKRVTSPYYPGKRSQAWIKTPLRNTQEVIIGGWTEGGGRRSGTLGALLLGVHDQADSRLRYVGRVGTGFTQTMLRDLQAILQAQARTTSPFDEPVPREDARGAHWVEPTLVGEVEHRQWTPTDNRLRHPSWRGLRPDREPEEVTAAFHVGS
jgi:bifunctional non-homologous end joining protein LigD